MLNDSDFELIITILNEYFTVLFTSVKSYEAALIVVSNTKPEEGENWKEANSSTVKVIEATLKVQRERLLQIDKVKTELNQLRNKMLESKSDLTFNDFSDRMN